MGLIILYWVVGEEQTGRYEKRERVSGMLDVQLGNGGPNNTEGDKPIAQPSLHRGPASLGGETSLYTHAANLPSPFSSLARERHFRSSLDLSLSLSLLTVCWVFSQM